MHVITQKLGAALVNILLTFALSVWLRPHQVLPQTLVYCFQSAEPICCVFVFFFYFYYAAAREGWGGA